MSRNFKAVAIVFVIAAIAMEINTNLACAVAGAIIVLVIILMARPDFLARKQKKIDDDMRSHLRVYY